MALAGCPVGLACWASWNPYVNFEMFQGFEDHRVRTLADHHKHASFRKEREPPMSEADLDAWAAQIQGEIEQVPT